MVKRTKTMVAAGTVALALAGTGAGVVAAQTTSTPSAPTTAANPAPTNPAPGAKHPGTGCEAPRHRVRSTPARTQAPARTRVSTVVGWVGWSTASSPCTPKPGTRWSMCNAVW